MAPSQRRSRSPVTISFKHDHKSRRCCIPSFLGINVFKQDHKRAEPVPSGGTTVWAVVHQDITSDKMAKATPEVRRPGFNHTTPAASDQQRPTSVILKPIFMVSPSSKQDISPSPAATHSESSDCSDGSVAAMSPPVAGSASLPPSDDVTDGTATASLEGPPSAPLAAASSVTPSAASSTELASSAPASITLHVRPAEFPTQRSVSQLLSRFESASARNKSAPLFPTSSWGGGRASPATPSSPRRPSYPPASEPVQSAPSTLRAFRGPTSPSASAPYKVLRYVGERPSPSCAWSAVLSSPARRQQLADEAAHARAQHAPRDLFASRRSGESSSSMDLEDSTGAEPRRWSYLGTIEPADRELFERLQQADVVQETHRSQQRWLSHLEATVVSSTPQEPASDVSAGAESAVRVGTSVSLQSPPRSSRASSPPSSPGSRVSRGSWRASPQTPPETEISDSRDDDSPRSRWKRAKAIRHALTSRPAPGREPWRERAKNLENDVRQIAIS